MYTLAARTALIEAMPTTPSMRFTHPTDCGGLEPVADHFSSRRDMSWAKLQGRVR